ncbi:sugar phosphate isomerase/epimerase [Arthrobacter sp. UYNi723]
MFNNELNRRAIQGSYMRTAFSTLGCPEAGLEQVIALAREHCIDGLELRIHDDGIVSRNMERSAREQVRGSVSRAGLSVLSLGSYIKICQPGPDDVVLGQLRTSLELAADVGAEAVRVFPGAGTEPTAEARAGALKELEVRGSTRLAAAARVAERLGVKLLLETHDSHPRGADIARILAPVGAQAPVGAIWDVMHPWRSGEGAAETLHSLGKRFEYVQFKDATMDRPTGELKMTLPGAGDIPLRRILELIEAQTAEGDSQWISLEWEKAWHPELPGLSEALVAFRAVLGRSVGTPTRQESPPGTERLPAYHQLPRKRVRLPWLSEYNDQPPVNPGRRIAAVFSFTGRTFRQSGARGGVSTTRSSDKAVAKVVSCNQLYTEFVIGA